MYTIDQTYKYTQIIKKSTFICTLIPVKNIDDVNKKLKDIRKKYYDATHNCYSYVLTDDDNNEVIKASDDGEPSQTAGVVILDVLKKQSLTNVLAVVTRYFGGVKLGAGGLVRAYSSTTSETVKLATIREIIKTIPLTITINYSYVTELLNLFKDFEITNQTYNENVTITFIIPEKEKEFLVSKVINLTKNSASFS